MADELQVRINSPEKIIWEGVARSVSSENREGPFDILPMHANFITFAENKTVRVRTGKKTDEYKFPRFVIYAHKNKVLIYTNI